MLISQALQSLIFLTADMSLLIDFCVDYRTYLHVRCKVSSILFSTIISNFDLSLFKRSLISISKQKQTLHHQPPNVRLMFETIVQDNSLAKSRSSQSFGLNLFIHL